MNSLQSTTTWRSIVAIIFVTALAARVVYVAAVGPRNLELSADARCYDDLAMNLLIRHEFVTAMDPPHRLDLPYANRPPLTPLFLAGVYSIIGVNRAAAQFALAFVGAVGCLLVALLAKRLFGTWTGSLAGAMAALYPFFVFLPSIPLTENLAIPLYVSLAMLLLAIGQTSDRRVPFAAGAVLGLAALNKPTILGVLPLVALWTASGSRGLRRRNAETILVLAMGVIVVTAPWLVRSSIRLGRFVPITTQTASTIYQGVGFHADYPILRLEQGATGWYNQRGSGIEVPGDGQAGVEPQRLRFAVEFIRQHPWKFLTQAARKMRIFWGAYPHPIHQISWTVVAGLSAAGLWLTRQRWRELMPIYLLIVQTALIPVVFTSMPRFRVPIEPFLLIFAAAAVAIVAGKTTT